MKEILTSIRLVILSVLVCCVIYPAAMLLFGRIVVPWKADGSLLASETGHIIGSAKLAQGFTRPEYFWPRPSAVNYDASATGGSNLSPTNPKLSERAESIIKPYGLKDDEHIPADLVTASGSGMDPHITLEAARFQAARVAAARGLPQERLETLILQDSEVPTLRVFGGEMLVNVLRLNLALDGLAEGDTPRL